MHNFVIRDADLPSTNIAKYSLLAKKIWLIVGSLILSLVLSFYDIDKPREWFIPGII